VLYVVEARPAVTFFADAVVIEHGFRLTALGGCRMASAPANHAVRSDASLTGA